jgi:hypothetical protein
MFPFQLLPESFVLVLIIIGFMVAKDNRGKDNKRIIFKKNINQYLKAYSFRLLALMPQLNCRKSSKKQ